MPVHGGGAGSQLHELYARAHAARRHSQALVRRHQAARRRTAETLQVISAAKDRAKQLQQLWLAGHPTGQLLRYSAYARLQAQLASMPVVEQAKGILMAQCGWTGDQAFDALRRASQRENIKVRDLAARIVAATARPESARPQPGPPATTRHRHSRNTAA